MTDKYFVVNAMFIKCQQLSTTGFEMNRIEMWSPFGIMIKVIYRIPMQQCHSMSLLWIYHSHIVIIMIFQLPASTENVCTVNPLYGGRLK